MTKKYIKKTQGFLLLLIVGLFSLLQPFQVPAAGKTSNLDAVIVLDVSGSMKTTDEKRIALDGAKLFIDMMDASSSSAGFTAFDSTVATKYDLTALDTSAKKQKIKQGIDALEYKRGDTNIGDALETSLQMLENAPETGNKKMLLLFTDGNIDLDNRPNVESEEEKISLQMARDAAARAAEEGIQIFTIGLNAGKNDRFQMDPSLITEVADTANGICRIVSSADELPGAFNDIFAHMIDSEIADLGDVTITSQDTYEEKEIHIPNESVLEANVILFTGESEQLDDIRITDPDQNTLEPDDDRLFVSDSNVYQLLKIIAPKAGDWLLQLKGKEGSIIHVDLVFNYDITMEASLDADESNDVVHVSARLLRKGQLLADEAIYSQLSAEASVSNTNGTEETIPMTLNEDLIYVCDVSVKEDEAVRIRVHVEGANMYRDSEELEFSRIPPAVEEEPSDDAQTQNLQNHPSGSDADGTVGDTDSLEKDGNALADDASSEEESGNLSSDGENSVEESLSEDAFDDDFQIIGEESETDDEASDAEENSLISRLQSSPAAERILQPDVGIAAGLIALILLLLFLMRKR
ncbi:MAG: VWA domain-containing protein [Blautia sp.]|nr:VWA domain-containing protein [Blautia sp.]